MTLFRIAHTTYREMNHFIMIQITLLFMANRGSLVVWLKIFNLIIQTTTPTQPSSSVKFYHFLYVDDIISGLL